MPSQHCFWPDDCDRIGGRRAKAVEPNEDEPVEVCQARPLWRPEDIDLLTKNQDFDLKPSPRREQRCKEASKQNQNFDHEDEASNDSLPLASPNSVSGRHCQHTTVAAAIRQAFLQADPAAAHHTWRHVADQLRPRWPKLAVLMDESEHDVLNETRTHLSLGTDAPSRRAISRPPLYFKPLPKAQFCR